jgi:hypothetical protein
VPTQAGVHLRQRLVPQRLWKMFSALCATALVNAQRYITAAYFLRAGSPRSHLQEDREGAEAFLTAFGCPLELGTSWFPSDLLVGRPPSDGLLSNWAPRNCVIEIEHAARVEDTGLDLSVDRGMLLMNYDVRSPPRFALTFCL